ncbi:hypothetical protein Pcinc_007026 [Petrolisthes cinctipes]|uniref:Poly [ADP-ribose] polymerase n=1 Tax=Petrolisthes cinctipes TaxID=88211 RepID=A0AAE1G9C1_PETCI|nr:hypothetical protein Pcinc_007026 [Petrolisthes cinctipes]
MSTKKTKESLATLEDHSSDEAEEADGRVTVIGLQLSARPGERRGSLGVPEACWEGSKKRNNTQHIHIKPDHDQEEWKDDQLNDEEENGISRIEDWIMPRKLAKELAKNPHFSATYEKLQQELGNSHIALTRTVNAYGSTFRLHKNVVELRPRLALCKEHISGDGCQTAHCTELHICPQYVDQSCDNDRCGLGHTWYTDHNQMVIQDFYLDQLNTTELHHVIAYTFSSIDPFGPLEICSDYNNINLGCKGGCTRLHICCKFVEGRGICEDENCDLSHDFTDSRNQWLLIMHDLSTNETPRDIVITLLNSNPGLFPNSPTESPSLNPDYFPNSSDNEGSDNDNSTNNTITQWSHDPFCDAQKSTICEASVVDLCRGEDTGCSRLHAPLHFHWQVSENGMKWYNLRHHQAQCLERSYCDVQQQGTNLPSLKPSAMEPWWMPLFKLLDLRTWVAYFNKMILMSGERRLQLRRLCTEDETRAASTFHWYREISENHWQEYGKDQNEDSVINITSGDIEEKWQENPNQTILCSGSFYFVSIDFETMTESVSSTQNQREVRRRPKPHLRCDSVTQGAPFRLLDVATFDAEYNKIVTLLNHTSRCYSSIKIKKLDNSLLRRAFQSHVAELNEQQHSVEIRQLFQAVDPALLSVICSENFNWRHQCKQRSSMRYGRGCYFYSRACEALEQRPQPHNETQKLVVARVVVGSWTPGNTSMTAPPFNPDTDIRYNTTVNKSDRPTVFVKYNSHEYYPEYLVMLQ